MSRHIRPRRGALRKAARVWRCAARGPLGAFGPPKDPKAALAVLREAAASWCEPDRHQRPLRSHVSSQLIRKAPHPYADDMIIVTKIVAGRGANASWQPALSARELREAVHNYLRNLGLDVIDVVSVLWGCDQRASSRVRAHDYHAHAARAGHSQIEAYTLRDTRNQCGVSGFRQLISRCDCRLLGSGCRLRCLSETTTTDPRCGVRQRRRTRHHRSDG